MTLHLTSAISLEAGSAGQWASWGCGCCCSRSRCGPWWGWWWRGVVDGRRRCITVRIISTLRNITLRLALVVTLESRSAAQGTRRWSCGCGCATATEVSILLTSGITNASGDGIFTVSRAYFSNCRFTVRISSVIIVQWFKSRFGRRCITPFLDNWLFNLSGVGLGASTHLLWNINTVFSWLQLRNKLSDMLALNSWLQATFLLRLFRGDGLGLLKALLRTSNQRAGAWSTNLHRNLVTGSLGGVFGH